MRRLLRVEHVVNLSGAGTPGGRLPAVVMVMPIGVGAQEFSARCHGYGSPSTSGPRLPVRGNSIWRIVYFSKNLEDSDPMATEPRNEDQRPSQPGPKNPRPWQASPDEPEPSREVRTYDHKIMIQEGTRAQKAFSYRAAEFVLHAQFPGLCHNRCVSYLVASPSIRW